MCRRPMQTTKLDCTEEGRLGKCSLGCRAAKVGSVVRVYVGMGEGEGEGVWALVYMGECGGECDAGLPCSCFLFHDHYNFCTIYIPCSHTC